MSATLVEQKKPVKKSVKKSSSIRTRKTITRLSQRNEKSAHKPVSLKGRHTGFVDGKVVGSNYNTLSSVSIDETKQKRKKKKKRKVNIRKAKQKNSLKINGKRNSKSKTTKPVFPRDVRTKYEALSVDGRINTTIAELIKNAQVGTNQVNLQFD